MRIRAKENAVKKNEMQTGREKEEKHGSYIIVIEREQQDEHE